MRGRLTVILACVLAASISTSCGSGRTEGRLELDPGEPITTRIGDVTIQLGERVVLLKDGGLGLRYFPDQGVVALGLEPLSLLVVSTTSTWLLEGSDVLHLDRAREILEPGPRGSFDNGYAGIGGIHRHADGRLYAFYHAEDQEGIDRLPGMIPGYYASVGVAVSKDDGSSWQKLGPAVTSAKPKSWKAYEHHNARGAGLPSTVLDPSGRYLLLYYNEQSLVDHRGTQVFLARADVESEPPLPGRFRKYHRGEFEEPGLGGLDTPVLSANHLDQANATQPFVVYSRALGRYVMIVHIHFWKEDPANGVPPTLPGRNSGIYVAFSQDGIHWSRPERLIEDRVIPRVGMSISWESGILFDPGSTSEGWLIYGYSERWGHGRVFLRGTPHYMVGRRIRLSARDPPRAGNRAGTP